MLEIKRVILEQLIQKENLLDFPGPPVAGTLHFIAEGPGSVPHQGTEISIAAAKKQKRNQECSTSNNTVKRVREQLTEWKKIIVNHVSEKKHVSRTYKELSQLHYKKNIIFKRIEI